MTLLLLFNAPASSGGATGTAFQSFVEAGMFLGQWQIDDYITFTACIHDDTGAAANADDVPSYAIYEDETAAAIVSGNMAQLGAVTGFYTERVQLTTAAGFEEGKCYAVRVAATVGGIDAAAAHVFQVEAHVWSYPNRTLTEGSTTTTDATAAGSITRKRGNSWSISLTLGAITGYTSLWFTVKHSYDDPDSAAILQIKLNASTTDDDLLTVNGAAATDATKGTITVSDAGTGAIVVAVDETITDDLPVGSFYYDAQVLISGNVTTPEAGTLTISADVTRAVA